MEKKSKPLIHDERSYAFDLGRMLSDLVSIGACYFTIAVITFLLLISAWYLSETLLTLMGLFLGGGIGVLIPLMGIERSVLVEYIGEPKHDKTYSHALQAAIWKYRKKTVLFLTAPYFYWIVTRAFSSSLDFGGDYGNAAVITILSALCLFGFSMGVLSWQVYWSLSRTGRKHETQHA